MKSLPLICLILVALLFPVKIVQALEIFQGVSKKDAMSGFEPHKALYEISLEEARSGSQIINISGQMYYEWAADCDGWNSNHRFNLLYEYTDSTPLRITSDFSVFENYDGKMLSFSSQRKHNGKVIEEVRGVSNVDDDHAGLAEYTIPKDLTYDLPKGTLYPVAHNMELVRKMKEGEKFYNAVIFDGSDDEGAVEINSFIGKKIEEQYEDMPNIDKALLKGPAREVRLAFFPLKDASETSDYEMTVNLRENSVISNMRIEYDDFTIRQNLIALEPVENACNQAVSKQ